ncbi:hypothetical protein [Rugosimonospora africana]|uniref:Uncharacterized protein n=1 Tax=Rugosimonospora africana TaxID=556532 RepID=A0A8J3VVU5_9ACTN|nr:hypothetical protein [Rugosimonospora africana]GIH20695.1 hypothetical protein Raf01_88670 [Rugosimonospora africana]
MTGPPLSVGFLLPVQERILAADPMVRTSTGVEVAGGQALPDWDYFTNLSVHWPATVDLPGLLDDCTLTSGARVLGLVTWHTSGTGMRGNGPVTVLSAGGTVFTADVPGAEAGGVLHLSLRVVLAATDPDAGPLAPRRPGSILWQTATRVALEGAGSRFPVVQLSFARAGIAGGRRALWYLNCGRDLDASDTGSIRLYLNTDHPAVESIISSPAGAGSKVLAELIRADVARQMVLHALDHDELDPDAGYEQGTLGDMLVNLLRRCFPARTLHDLRGDRDIDPGEFEAGIQAALGVMVP